MLPWLHLDSAPLPDGSGEMRLFRRGEEFSVRLGIGVELMNSRQHGSEEALARLGCAGLAGRARVLVGGLGLGFTLRATLDALGPDAEVVVAELVPALVGWARGPLAPVFGAVLDDARVEVRIGDVGALLRASPAGFDSILLDVDNGPEALTVPGNDSLYGPAGLGTARAALRPGGTLAVWSAAPDAAFGRRLSQAGFTVAEHRERARGARGGARHVIWLARLPKR